MKKIHIIGIGGIGMSALAWIALEKGYIVSGSDKQKSSVIFSLEKRGVKIFLDHQAANINRVCEVVYSSAIKDTNPEILRAKEIGCTLYHRSELLFEWMDGKKQIIIGGAHGKTTTTSLLIHVLKQANLKPSFVVGGLSESLGKNGGFDLGDYFVAEGDESDGSFLRSRPFTSILTGMDLDHVDYWNSESALDDAYDRFINQSENLIYCIDDPKLASRLPKGLSYGFSKKADIQALYGEVINQKQTMTFSFQGEIFPQIPLSLFGRHNVLNSLAVFGVCQILRLRHQDIFESFASFKGVQRRMQLKGVVRGVTYVDDYAHHPKEVEVTVQAMRTKVEKGKLFLVFQPHRFSRFHRFLNDFAKALEGQEPLIITDIYSAGEENSYKVDSRDLVELLVNKGKRKVLYVKRDSLKDCLFELTKEGDTVLAMGAGDITRLKEEML
jgi:UDP-N-acetylmuramate--alanine ligase